MGLFSHLKIRLVLHFSQGHCKRWLRQPFMGYDSLRTDLTWYLQNTRDFPSPSFFFPALFLEALPQCKSLLLSPSVAVSYSVMSSLWVIFEPRLSDIEQDSKISLKKNFFFLFFSFSLTCSIIDPKCLAWRVPWTEEPGGLQSLGSRRVGDDWATSLSCTGEGNGNPLMFLPRESQGWRSLAGCRLWGCTESDRTEVT